MFRRGFFLALVAVMAWVIWRALREQSAADLRTPPRPPQPSGPIVSTPPAAAVSPPPAPPAPAEAPAEAAEPAGPEAAAEPTLTLEVYCVRCKERRTIAGAREETTASGRRAARGVCPVCGATVFTFLPSHEE